MIYTPDDFPHIADPQERAHAACQARLEDLRAATAKTEKAPKKPASKDKSS